MPQPLLSYNDLRAAQSRRLGLMVAGAVVGDAVVGDAVVGACVTTCWMVVIEPTDAVSWLPMFVVMALSAALCAAPCAF